MYEKERFVAFKIRHNPFSVGSLLRTRWGAHDAPSDPLVGWGGDTPPHPTPLGTDPPSVLAMPPPQNSSQIMSSSSSSSSRLVV